MIEHQRQLERNKLERQILITTAIIEHIEQKDNLTHLKILTRSLERLAEEMEHIIGKEHLNKIKSALR